MKKICDFFRALNCEKFLICAYSPCYFHHHSFIYMSNFSTEPSGSY